MPRKTLKYEAPIRAWIYIEDIDIGDTIRIQTEEPSGTIALIIQKIDQTKSNIGARAIIASIKSPIDDTTDGEIIIPETDDYKKALIDTKNHGIIEINIKIETIHGGDIEIIEIPDNNARTEHHEQRTRSGEAGGTPRDAGCRIPTSL